MTRHSAPEPSWAHAVLPWLLVAGVGPAAVAVPVNWAADALAGAAQRWFRRLMRADGLSRLVKAAAGTSADLSHGEFSKVRRLLEEEQTWALLGNGTVKDLAARIARSLPPRDGRTAEDSQEAAMIIARGLLESAVADLEPGLFQQVLLTRLQRIENNQASALDEALFASQAAVVARLEAQGDLSAQRFDIAMGHLRRALDRLPPGRAGAGEVLVYLKILIGWLNTDPWPQDARFGPELTPAVIERKLRIVTTQGRDERESEADDLASRCARLVVLGGPGSGKTWLAKRTARRCAEAALNALTAGAGLDEVELPLYTTCAQLAAAPPGDGIRRTVVTSAFGQLPDVGGSRVLEALRMLFEDRDAPTLLVADSLDEAYGAANRIRQADTLPPAWRIVITSRPSSWNRQFAIGAGDPSRRVGVLQPLRYPGDVEPFIAGWFSGQPQWATGLTAQLRDRPALQQAATVPLILSFYCMIGGSQPLPTRRAELYGKVIVRMLTGRWRGSDNHDPDVNPEACLEILRDWAWSAVACDPVSGVGAWVDEFPTARVRHSPDNRDALGHVAPTLGPANVDTRMSQRRFAHRSLHEHLVAEHIALRMTARQAAAELLSHVWYDADWEYAAPAALAMHPQRDQVLKELISGVTRSDQLPADLAAIDGCWEFRRFLARMAQESSESDWPPWAAAIIGQARIDLVMSRQRDNLQVVASDWPTSNGPIIESLLTIETGPGESALPSKVLAQLDLGTQERARAREALLTRLANVTDPWSARDLAQALARLDPTMRERSRAVEFLLAPLAGRTRRALLPAEALVHLGLGPQEEAQAREALLTRLASTAHPWGARDLVQAFARLNPPPQQKARAREALLTRLASVTDPGLAWDLARALAGLDLPAQEKPRAGEALLTLLASETNPGLARDFVEALASLDPTAQEKARAREMLLTLLASVVGPGLARTLAGVLAGLARGLVEALARLDPTMQDKARARDALLTLLSGPIKPWMAESLVEALAGLDPTMQDKARARDALLTLLASETNPGLAGKLAQALGRLDPTAQEKPRAREALLTLLASETKAGMTQDLAKAWALQILFTRFANVSGMAQGLVQALAGLEPPAQEEAHTGWVALLSMLAEGHGYMIARDLVEALAGLDPTAREKARARQALLTLLASATKPASAWELAQALAGLDPTAREKARAREALLTLLASAANPGLGRLAQALAGLDPTAREKARARQALLTLLASATNPLLAQDLVEALAGLDPTVQEKARAREALLTLLASATEPPVAMYLSRALVSLSPTIANLDNSDNWPVPPTSPLLAAVRKNSSLPAWLTTLPLFCRPTHTAAACAAAPATPNKG